MGRGRGGTRGRLCLAQSSPTGLATCPQTFHSPACSRFQWWLVPLPFGLLIFVYDEIRKLGVRRHPGSKSRGLRVPPQAGRTFFSRMEQLLPCLGFPLTLLWKGAVSL